MKERLIEMLRRLDLEKKNKFISKSLNLNKNEDHTRS
jgi:hypothetical protein